ncbi:MAG: hypothetical protein ACLR68_02090 [Gemmiger formicilis]|jgi:hypothetical protein|uniref:hypothetical protein n=1 Tax=Gemmiger formicilis TaxID=745368 RepID=UPI0039A20108
MGDMLFLKCNFGVWSDAKSLKYFFFATYLTVSQWLYSRGAFSKILRTVAKVATVGLYDMIWNLSKNLNFF